MIGDFDGSANALWSLYGTEAKSRDESQIQTLKDDMDGVLIFVSSHFVHSYDRVDHADARPVGRSIFCCSHFVHNRQQTEFDSEPIRPDGVLPPTKRRCPLPDISTNLLSSPTVLHPFDSATRFPCFQSIRIRCSRERVLVHGPHFQSFCRTPCDPRPAMGSGLYARLSTIQRSSEERPNLTILV